MRHRKRLYDTAKQSGRSEDWAAYRSMRNQVNNDLQRAHSAYCSRLFEDSFSGNRRHFWKYIRSRRKDSSGISTLLDNGEYISYPQGKLLPLIINSNLFLPLKIIIVFQVCIPSIIYLLCLPSLLVLRGFAICFVILMPAKLWVLTGFHPIY